MAEYRVVGNVDLGIDENGEDLDIKKAVTLTTDGIAWPQWWQYQRKDKTNCILTRLFWNDPVMRLRFWLEGNPLRRICSWLGYILLRLAGEQ